VHFFTYEIRESGFMLKIRLASVSDIEWINSKYKEVDFVSSEFSNEIIVIAEVNDCPAGLGRLVTIDENTGELGGMYVFEKYRNQGIARAIVQRLLDEGAKYKVVYCLPFDHLKSFYQSFGFKPFSGAEFLPEKIKDKYDWCNQHYLSRVLLLCKYF